MVEKNYSELQRFSTFLDRYNYLKLGGTVGRSTFGFDRHLNQRFYVSREWRQTRHHVIARDMGCDMGIEGFEIFKGLYIHHMNPITTSDIVEGSEDILDPEFLITVTHETHNAIHYGTNDYGPRVPIVRRPGDTKLW